MFSYAIYKRSIGGNVLWIFIVWAVGRIISGQSVGKIILTIPRFRVCEYNNKNIDHRVKRTCAIMSTQVTYETNHISLFLLFTSLLCSKRKNHIARNINSKKKEMFIGFSRLKATEPLRDLLSVKSVQSYPLSIFF